MNLARYLNPDLMKLELETDPETLFAEEEVRPDRLLWEVKRSVLTELVHLFERSGEVANPSKLFIDLFNREKKATTGLEKGVAIPHVRTIQAKSFIMAFARSTRGIDFDALDGQPTYLFFGLVCPPYEDRTYLKAVKDLMSLARLEEFRKKLLGADSEHEVIRAFKEMG
jgi:mannitol/fructose-specific phosphotransferase system IIA component (Ntr-type)